MKFNFDFDLMRFCAEVRPPYNPSPWEQGLAFGSALLLKWSRCSTPGLMARVGQVVAEVATWDFDSQQSRWEFQCGLYEAAKRGIIPMPHLEPDPADRPKRRSAVVVVEETEA